MAGLGPAIHDFRTHGRSADGMHGVGKDMDGRAKPGQDGEEAARSRDQPATSSAAV